MKKSIIFMCLILIASHLTVIGVTTDQASNESTITISQNLWKNMKASIPVFIMGIILVVVGLISTISFFILWMIQNRKYHLLLYLGIYTLLYGIRIQAGTYLLGGFYHHALLWKNLEPIISYVIPIPAIFIVKHFVGWGWKNSIRWILVMQIIYSSVAILAAVYYGRPALLMSPYYLIMLTLNIFVGLANLFLLDWPKNTWKWKIRLGIILFLIPIMNDNMVDLGLLPWRFQFEHATFFILICILFLIALYQVFWQQKKVQTQLMQADKMVALGTLVSGVAHEINNPNNFIRLNSEILTRIWLDSKPVLDRYAQENATFSLAGVPYDHATKRIPEFISDIHKGAERIKNIIQSLKDYARPSGTTLQKIDQAVDINKVIHSVQHLLSNPIKTATRHFYIDCQEDLPKIKGNAQQLEQVMVNLLLNSCQALQNPEKSITISTRFQKEDKNLYIQVTDEGIGIPSKDLPQITNPFFTTKQDKGGLGLGLSISTTIIKEHGGKILINSKSGKGTTVLLILPVALDLPINNTHRGVHDK